MKVAPVSDTPIYDALWMERAIREMEETFPEQLTVVRKAPVPRSPLAIVLDALRLWRSQW